MFDGIPIDKLSAPFLVLLAVLMMFLGLLVPRYVYKRMEKERDDWKLAYEIERETRITLQGQLVELLEIGRTSKDVLVEWHEAARRLMRTGGREWDSSGDPRRPRKRLRQLLRMLSGVW